MNKKITKKQVENWLEERVEYYQGIFIDSEIAYDEVSEKKQEKLQEKMDIAQEKIDTIEEMIDSLNEIT